MVITERLIKIEQPLYITEWDGWLAYVGEDTARFYFIPDENFREEVLYDVFYARKLTDMASAAFRRGEKIPNLIEEFVS